MKVLSLFDGISIARQALKNCGIDVEAYYASEIDKYAIQVSQKNWPSIWQIGDVANVNGYNYSNIDLLIGGSPCQDLSIAKKGREGLKGSRSGLFYEYVRILKEVKPKYFILENVNSMPKEAKETITKELFGIEPIMINAALVSAQNRKRLFWVGKLVGDTYEQVKIELPEDRGILLRDILESEVDEKYYVSTKHAVAMRNSRKSKKLNIPSGDGKCGVLTASYYKIPNDGNYIPVDNNRTEEEQRTMVRIGKIGKGGQRDRIYSQDGKSVYKGALNDGMSLIPMKSKTIRTSGRGSGIDDKHNWDTIRIGKIGKGGQADRIYSQDGKSVSLSANSGGRGDKTGLYCVGNLEGGPWDKRHESCRRVYSPEGQCPTIPAGVGGGVTPKIAVGAKTGLYAVTPNGYKTNDSRPEIGQANRVYQSDGKIVPLNSWSPLTEQNHQIRKLTPIECERLQSLPDNFSAKGITEKGEVDISNTQRYKVLGNGFNCAVIEHILKSIDL